MKKALRLAMLMIVASLTLLSMSSCYVYRHDGPPPPPRHHDRHHDDHDHHKHKKPKKKHKKGKDHHSCITAPALTDYGFTLA